MLQSAAGVTHSSPRDRYSSPTRILSGQNEDEEEGADDKIYFEGQMLRKSGERKLKGYWYKLQNRDLFFYKRQDDPKHKGMYALAGVFIKEEDPEPFDEDTHIYAFTLIFPSKERTFYLQKKEEYDTWVKIMKKAIGYQNFLDHYELKESIGKGKFGRVKLAIHIKTKK